jgi:hypothetical protein
MAAALHWLEGDGLKPDELKLLDAIDRFGVQAIMGRPTLGAGEMQSMVMADNVRRAWLSRSAYRDKDGEQNWAAWAEAEPELSEVLVFAMRAANG